MSGTLVLETLKNGLPGVTPALGEAHMEACLVCLDKYKHSSSIQLSIAGNVYTGNFDLCWHTPISQQISNSWRDLQDANEAAACGYAFLLILALTKYTVIYRSPKGTGVDYFLGFRDLDPDDLNIFKEAARLEVSGILQESDTNKIEYRVSKKKTQSLQSASTRLPAYIVCVEHCSPKVQVHMI